MKTFVAEKYISDTSKQFEKYQNIEEVDETLLKELDTLIIKLFTESKIFSSQSEAEQQQQINLESKTKIQEKINYFKALCYNQEAKFHFSSKKYDLCAECYSKAIKLDPKEPIFYSNKANALFRMNNVLKDEFTLRLINKAIKLTSKGNKLEWKFWFRKSEILERDKKYDQSIEILTKIIKEFESKDINQKAIESQIARLEKKLVAQQKKN